MKPSLPVELLFGKGPEVQGFGFVDKAGLGKEVILRHQGSGEETKLPVTWDAQGIADLSYTLPKEAKQGVYEIVVPHSLRGRPRDELNAGEFRVANYRVPTVRARLSGPTQAVNPHDVRWRCRLLSPGMRAA